jgi:DNA-binding transcriptional LysR family regulator
MAAIIARTPRRGRCARAPGRSHALWLEEVAAGARFVLRTNSIYALDSAAASGAGVAVLPCFLGDAEARLARVALPSPVPSPELWLAVQQDLQRSPRVRAAIAFLDDVLAETRPLLRGALP